MNPPVIKHLGLVDYVPTWKDMEQFTLERGPETPDEIWFLEHPPVFTLGLAGKMEHVLAPGDIPVAQLASAEEIWLASSTREVYPVTQVDGKPAGGAKPGPHWKRMFDLFQKHKASH